MRERRENRTLGRKVESVGDYVAPGEKIGGRRFWKGKCLPCYAPMESPTFQHTSQVLFGRLLLIRVDKIYECLADEKFSLFSEVVLQHGVEIQKVEVGGQECPVYRGKEVKDGE